MSKSTGINIGRIVSDNSTINILKSFLCKKCQLVQYEIYSCTNSSCGEYSCSECLINNINICPFCNGNLNNSKGMMIKSFQKILIECENKETGCKEKLRYFDLSSHENNCLYRNVKCSSNFCNYKDLAKNIGKHEDICENFALICISCKEVMRRKDQLQHESECEQKQITCEYCMESFSGKILEKHNSICQLYEIDCEICHGRYPRIKKNDHNCVASINSNVKINVELIEERIHSIETKIFNMDNYIQRLENGLNEKFHKLEENLSREIRRMIENSINPSKDLTLKFIPEKSNLIDNILKNERDKNYFQTSDEDKVLVKRDVITQLYDEINEIKQDFIANRLLCLQCENRPKVTICKSCNKEYCNYCITKCKNCNIETCAECIRMSPNCKEKCINIFCKFCFDERFSEDDNTSFNIYNFFKCKICHKIHCKNCGNNNKCNVCSILCCSDCIQKCTCCNKNICIYCFKYYEMSIQQTIYKIDNEFLNKCQHINTNSEYNPLILGGYDGYVINYNLLNTKIMQKNQVHSFKSYLTSIIKFNDKLITSSTDGFLRVWKDSNFSSKIFEFSNNDKHLIHPITQTIAISETLFAASTSTKKQALIFYCDNNINSYKLIKKLDTDSYLNSLCKLNENYLILGGSNMFMWNLPKNELVSKFNIHDSFQVDNIIRLKKTNATLASTAGDNKLKIWNEKGKVLLSFDNANLNSSNYCKITELNDGRVLTSTNDFNIKLYDLKSKDIVTFKNHNYFVHDFSILNEYNFVSCSGDYTIAKWDLRKNERVLTYSFDEFYPIRILNPLINCDF